MAAGDQSLAGSREFQSHLHDPVVLQRTYDENRASQRHPVTDLGLFVEPLVEHLGRGRACEALRDRQPIEGREVAERYVARQRELPERVLLGFARIESFGKQPIQPRRLRAGRDEIRVVVRRERSMQAAGTGKIGDGKIFVWDLERVVRIRTGELDGDAL